MSSIEAQIKALQMKKKKIDYVSYIADLIKNDTHCIDFKDVQKEVVEQIEPFLVKLMDGIEKDQEVSLENGEGLSTDDVKVLKLLAQKAMNRQPSVPNANVQLSNAANGAFSQESPPAKSKQQELREMSHNDKMNFALNNRHLGNKRVQVLNDQNAQIFGTVVGLDAPHVVVKTETGPTINVPLEKIVPV